MASQTCTNNPELMGKINQINDMITTTNTSCLVGSDCYNRTQASALKNTYSQAQYNMDNASAQYKDAKKNYIINTQGEQVYETQNQQEINAEASAFVLKKTETFSLYLQTAVNNNNNFSSIVDSSKYVDDVFLQITKNNMDLERNIINTDNDILTNDRKKYYEQENYDTLDWWYKLWLYIYILLLVVFAIAIFLANSQFSIMSKVGILILFIAYIFITKPIILWLFSVMRLLYSFLPKNVYLSL